MKGREGGREKVDDSEGRREEEGWVGGRKCGSKGGVEFGRESARKGGRVDESEGRSGRKGERLIGRMCRREGERERE